VRSGYALPALLLAVVSVMAGACGGDDAGPELSDTPPWGLTGIEMPNTEAELIAAFEAMPAIDGRPPVLSQMGADEFYPTATYYESEEGRFGVEIQALPDDDPLESLAPVVLEADGWSIEGHAVDPESELIWMAIGPAPDDEFEVFGFLWANLGGSWRFVAVADTAEFRINLVHAFITAVGV
jgi:hypothetical protein